MQGNNISLTVCLLTISAVLMLLLFERSVIAVKEIDSAANASELFYSGIAEAIQFNRAALAQYQEIVSRDHNNWRAYLKALHGSEDTRYGGKKH
ncbi:hypothetical protein IQ238_11215 [Pleurocapsales cyanobacterium LEGE 06147]|nr:hypothetical protein [Pleurocapsales cyanobacterium LEGE 06147]